MEPFQPLNRLETKLRWLLTNEDGRVWQFLRPLAAAPLWTVVRNDPALAGDSFVWTPDNNPGLCVLNYPEGAFLSVYTAEERVRTAFARFQLSEDDWVCAHAKGYGLLR